ncbi:MAG: hypothetical protein E5X53_28335 [Mesorhizobium sp.]|uniref:hypothetical protein n=1 Tax=Mesorhizobium sp. TaxID=1871066 RepID=UPI0011FCFA4B|nr:hypothetical protein [Mesorhizobium sp.]TIP70329.1 MAG: hypothetical protein E5X55_27815 [Mesorhizobium sp.]TIQ06726.1 MAG: hypothetical protein E5X57_24035 [Mesorhizobium sp.]TIR48633.1 MAG: hypothetical protein E5X53_28335 [Mesorhizobium sp.]TJV94678.1 MAG: hypothetical protein E5X52_27800 [Mesorhizobium sp.]
MTDRPILFSGPMVRALLAGTKTQTRRVLNPQPPADLGLVGIYAPKLVAVFGYVTPDADCKVALRYMPGDRLYVREAWKTHAAYDDISPAAMGGDEPILYVADGAHQTWGYPAISKIGRFRQGMHMPRWASRLTLIVTDVRVQRLQAINEADAVAEGCGWRGTGNSDDNDKLVGDPVPAYSRLWDGLNASRGFGWDVNPWVVAVSFTVERRNIDEVAA